MTLNLGCALIWVGVYIEQGMGLIIPGMTPDTLGQIFGAGSLVFTLLVTVAAPVLLGTFRAASAPHPGYARRIARCARFTRSTLRRGDHPV